MGHIFKVKTLALSLDKWKVAVISDGALTFCLRHFLLYYGSKKVKSLLNRLFGSLTAQAIGCVCVRTHACCWVGCAGLWRHSGKLAGGFEI